MPSPDLLLVALYDYSASRSRIRSIIREIEKIENGVRIQNLVHESVNSLKNRSESDESEARIHESYSQIFDSFDSRFIQKIRKIRVQITPLGAIKVALAEQPAALYATHRAILLLQSLKLKPNIKIKA